VSGLLIGVVLESPSTTLPLRDVLRLWISRSLSEWDKFRGRDFTSLAMVYTFCE
jgi:hypothetical protein